MKKNNINTATTTVAVVTLSQKLRFCESLRLEDWWEGGEPSSSSEGTFSTDLYVENGNVVHRDDVAVPEYPGSYPVVHFEDGSEWEQSYNCATGNTEWHEVVSPAYNAGDIRVEVGDWDAPTDHPVRSATRKIRAYYGDEAVLTYQHRLMNPCYSGFIWDESVPDAMMKAAKAAILATGEIPYVQWLN